MTNYVFQTIDKLGSDYQQLSRFARWFYPRALREHIEVFSRERSNEQALAVFRTFNTIGFFPRLFFRSLRAPFNSGETFYSHHLQAANLLTFDNLNAILNHAYKNQPYTSFAVKEVTIAIKELSKHGVLTRPDAQELLNIVIGQRSCSWIAEAIAALHGSNLLTRANLDKLTTHEDPHFASIGVRILGENSLLIGPDAQLYLDDVLAHREPMYLARIFVILREKNLLSEENRRSVIRHGNLEQFHNALLAISKSTDLLTGDTAQANFNKLSVVHLGDRYGYVQTTFNSAAKCGLLRGRNAQANFDAIITHSNPDNLRQAFFVLEEERILFGSHVYYTYKLLHGPSGQANFDAIVTHENPLGVIGALLNLDKHGLLKGKKGQDNRDIAATYAEPGRIACALLALSTVRQIDFDRLMRHAAILLSSDAWARIPNRVLTSAQFDRIIEIAEAHVDNPTAGQTAFRAHIDDLLLHRPVRRAAGAVPAALTPAYNPLQSTHTASVHLSVSESASRLKAAYGARISTHAQLTAMLDSLSAWLNEQSTANWFTRWFRRPPNVLKLEAARRCLDRIRHPGFSYTDMRSDVSMQELIALLWIGTTDDAKRNGTVNDAQQRIIDALYESQREYNLSDVGVDTGGADRPSCAGGTFNKCVEKFSGIHRDVNLIIITREGASAKFQALIKEEAMAYLRQLKTDRRLEELSRLLDEIEADDNENAVGPLWDFISERTVDRLFEEYKSLYSNDRNNRDFQALISAGEYVKLDVVRLNALRSEIAAPTSAAGTGLIPPPATASQAGFFAPTGTDAGTEALPAQDQLRGPPL